MHSNRVYSNVAGEVTSAYDHRTHRASTVRQRRSKTLRSVETVAPDVTRHHPKPDAKRDEEVSSSSSESSSDLDEDSKSNLIAHPHYEDQYQWDLAMSTLQRKVSAMRLASGLIFHFIYVVVFCFYFLYNNDTFGKHGLYENILTTYLHKEQSKFRQSHYFEDIGSADEYSDFLLDVVVPQLCDIAYPAGPNLYLGAMRVRTQRARAGSCTLNPDVFPPGLSDEFLECYGGLGGDNEERGNEWTRRGTETLWHYKSCEALSEGQPMRTPPFIGYLASYHCGGYYFDIPFWRPNSTLNEKLLVSGIGTPFTTHRHERVPQQAAEEMVASRLLKGSSPFVDNVATRFIVAELVMYSPPLQSFVSLRMAGEVNSGGEWTMNGQIMFADLYTAGENGHLAVHIIFTILVFFFLMRFVGSLLSLLRSVGRRTCAELFAYWNLLDVCVLSLSIASVVMHSYFMAKSTQVQSRLDEIMFTPAYPIQFDALFLLRRRQLYVDGTLTALLFAKATKFFALERHVDQVFHVIYKSRQSLIAIVLIFFVVTAIYAILCQLLFGLLLWDFRTVDTAFATMLRILLRQVNLNNLINSSLNGTETIFVLVSYIFFSCFCILNCLVGMFIVSIDVMHADDGGASKAQWAYRWLRRTLPVSSQWLSLFVRWLFVGGDADQLQHAIECLRSYRVIKYPSATFLQERDFHHLCYDDVELALQPQFGSSRHSTDKTVATEEVRALAKVIWGALRYEHAIVKASGREARVAKKDVRSITKGVQAVTAAHVQQLQKFPLRLAALESEVSLLLYRFARVEQAARTQEANEGQDDADANSTSD